MRVGDGEMTMMTRTTSGMTDTGDLGLVPSRVGAAAAEAGCSIGYLAIALARPIGRSRMVAKASEAVALATMLTMAQVETTMMRARTVPMPMLALARRRRARARPTVRVRVERSELPASS